MDVLGDTREAIAAEKLAVVQPGAPSCSASRSGRRPARAERRRRRRRRRAAATSRSRPRPPRRSSARPVDPHAAAGRHPARPARAPKRAAARDLGRRPQPRRRRLPPAAPAGPGLRARLLDPRRQAAGADARGPLRPGRHARRHGVLATAARSRQGTSPPAPNRISAMSRPFQIRSRPGTVRWPSRAPKGPSSSRAPSIFLPSSVAAATTHSVSEKLSVFALATFVLVADRRRRVRRGLFDRQNPFVIASTFGSTHDFFNSGAWLVIRNLLIFFAARLLGRDASGGSTRTRSAGSRTRGSSGVSCLLGVVVPFFGPFIYMLFRPPEYLDDVRERELEIKAMEDRLVKRDLHCPVCRTEVDSSFLVCPICTTKLKQACVTCKQPLEALWQVCPYCETPVEPTAVALPQFESRRRRRARVAIVPLRGDGAHADPDQAGRRPAQARRRDPRAHRGARLRGRAAASCSR